MVKGDAEYCKRFYWMVMEGLCCGLEHPCEWLTNTDRCIGDQNPVSIQDTTDFVDLAAVDIYETIHCCGEKATLKQANEWIHNYYSKPTVAQNPDHIGLGKE